VVLQKLRVLDAVNEETEELVRVLLPTLSEMLGDLCSIQPNASRSATFLYYRSNIHEAGVTVRETTREN
jgi:hypothetical protein